MAGIGPVPVLSGGWLQIGVSAFTMHDQALPPVPPLPTPLRSIPGLIEGPAFMGWPPGMLSHKTAPSVLSDGNPTVQQGHDIGYMIPHFAIPMNAMCALNTMLSKHKVAFPVSHVKVEGKPVGTYLFFLLGEILRASPVSLPTGVVILLKCTVWTSMTVGDSVHRAGGDCHRRRVRFDSGRTRSGDTCRGSPVRSTSRSWEDSAWAK